MRAREGATCMEQRPRTLPGANSDENCPVHPPALESGPETGPGSSAESFSVSVGTQSKRNWRTASRESQRKNLAALWHLSELACIWTRP